MTQHSRVLKYPLGAHISGVCCLALRDALLWSKLLHVKLKRWCFGAGPARDCRAVNLLSEGWLKYWVDGKDSGNLVCLMELPRQMATQYYIVPRLPHKAVSEKSLLGANNAAPWTCMETEDKDKAMFHVEHFLEP
jgi:hypothetical protein